MKAMLVIFLNLILFVNNYPQKASGFVFLDKNKNLVMDEHEEGVQGICVSNGIDVVRTDDKGNWQISVTDDTGIFLIKPSNYSVPTNKNMIPQYYYIHKPGGSPIMENKGVEPTGDLPNSINFPLVSNSEPNEFSALFFGDTQASSSEEVHYINHDVVEELIGTDAKFGVALGDIVGHDPDLFDEISKGIAKIGVPWYYIFGNHDSNHDAISNRMRDETFERYFGPSTYAFEYSNVVFIGLNNIYFNQNGKYKPHFSIEQIGFVKNYLNFVPDDKLVVLMMHIPIFTCENKELLFDLLDQRPFSFSISGHVHEQVNVFIDEKMNWKGNNPHHHLINATVSGSWWCGLHDELGIPHATMNDGAPNGYSVITFNGADYKVRFKAARKPENYQMNIYAPNEISVKEIDSTKILVNVFAGSERSKVEMKIGDEEYQPMKQAFAIDPECLRMHEQTPILQQNYINNPIEEILGWPMDYPSKSYHMWEAKIDSNITAGVYTINVRTRDMYGSVYEANRIIYIEE